MVEIVCICVLVVAFAGVPLITWLRFLPRRTFEEVERDNEIEALRAELRKLHKIEELIGLREELALRREALSKGKLLGEVEPLDDDLEWENVP